LEEYEEIIASHMSPLAANIAIETILRANNVIRVDAHYQFHLITTDPDDNKFVDCAVVANAEYIVTEDSHFNILKTTPFPPVEIKRLHEFYEELCTFDEP
jgi:predicted nucleic acid-binding protein